MRDGVLRAGHRAAGVDLMHQIKLLHVRLLQRSQLDRAGIVDEDIQTAEVIRRLVDGCLDCFIIANIEHDRQCLAASRFDFLGC